MTPQKPGPVKGSKKEKTWSIRPNAVKPGLFEAVSSHCEKNGIVLNHFVCTALIEKALALKLIERGK